MPYEYRRVSLRPQKHPASVFGLRLRQARIQADIPQDKLGVAIGLDETTASARISRYETGTHAAPYDLAVKIAKVLNVPPTFLFCNDDDLARLILLWAQMSKAEQRRLMAELST
ncbi:helix-turn-helix domain-containing protein [Hylemonella gracilis]|uniref:XRE family transcriptional regulator n=1 Tax=Hylemonella gracilis ATCC 19624 TaxID=887062 RepID=F3KUN7_9BURK|nr:helix-turn-helix transcriptional regulator [Hylemonella gracilis]EGI76517.1 XRE family transcriptional regulator [Hylemonella gracilis ATCC 19624]